MKNDKQRCGTRRYHQSEMKNPTTLISGTVTPKWTVPGERNLQINITSKTAEGNSEIDDNPANAINGKGSNVNVYFNPNSNPQIPTLNAKTGRVNGEKRPAHVGLAHELIHGDRSMRGVAIDYSENATYTYTNSRGLRVTQSLKKEEAATIGLKHVKKDDITENDIRKEQGLKLRCSFLI